jgi:hypothetical protein
MIIIQKFESLDSINTIYFINFLSEPKFGFSIYIISYKITPSPTSGLLFPSNLAFIKDTDSKDTDRQQKMFTILVYFIDS